LNRLAGSLPATTAATSPAPPTLLRRLAWDRFRPRTLGTRLGNSRHDACQTAQATPPTRLLAGPGVVLLDAFLELGEPFLDRSLDLRTRGSWLLGPDPGPVGSNRFGWWIGVGRLGLDRELRREFRHLSKC
jgi:hypothetical protein